MNPDVEEFKARFSDELEKIKKFTCQIFYDGVLEAEGTGILITDGIKYFLISAAHVIEKKITSLYIRNGPKTIVRLTSFESNINKTSDRKKDKIDVAVLKLGEDCVKDLIGYYEFLRINELGINHIVRPKDLYCGIGFPVTMTKRHYKTKVITANSTFIQFPAAEEEMYSKLDCNPATNIILFFPKREMINFKTDQRGTAPDVNGMSGGGLWKIFYNDEGQIEKRLVGILTEWSDKKNINYVISTRIDVVSEMLRNLYSVNIVQSEIYSPTYNIENID